MKKSFEQYFDEYYKLDYEDIIGDQPCRFKYRQVAANDYGLSVDEIFAAKDNELNAWVPVKRISQYRPETEEKFDQSAFVERAANVAKKRKILPSLFPAEEEKEKPENSVSNGGGKNAEKTKKKRKPKNKKVSANLQQKSEEKILKSGKNSKKTKKVSDAPKSREEMLEKMSDERMVAYGLNPKRIKNQLKYGKGAKRN